MTLTRNGLLAHVSLYGATILDRILDGKKLPFLPGGPLAMKEEIAALEKFSLISPDDGTPSKYRLTKKGREICVALWGDEKEQWGG